MAEAVDGLRDGQTPSPDILCNRRIKFGAFLDALEPFGAFDRVASGHYARIDRRGDHHRLRRGLDPKKDQTYFLFRLDQAQLQRTIFPIGDLRKSEVRERARHLRLPNHDRKDSQGICFLGKIPFDGFVRSYLGEQPGTIRDLDSGNALGRHRGPWFYTIGQRRGLGLGGGPWYVVSKDLETNEIGVVHADRLAEHATDHVQVAQVHWISGPPSDLENREIGVKLRHGPTMRRGRLRTHPHGLELQLDSADPGLASGQAAVFYDEDVCLGGGTIVSPSDRASSR